MNQPNGIHDPISALTRLAHARQRNERLRFLAKGMTTEALLHDVAHSRNEFRTMEELWGRFWFSDEWSAGNKSVIDGIDGIAALLWLAVVRAELKTRGIRRVLDAPRPH